MRQKRAKAYRKQMSYYQMNFKFREPYQLLVDDEIVLESCRVKLDLVKALERTIQAECKPMITQCCMEALYRSENAQAIALAKNFERRRCGHRPAPKGRAAVEAAEAYANKVKQAEARGDEPPKKPDDGSRKPHDCLWEVIVHNNQNKHRYVVATQKDKLRNRLRRIPAVPMLYLSRSVMVMEPMSQITERARAMIEQNKLNQGLNDPQLKKKTASNDAENSDSDGDKEEEEEIKRPKPKPKAGPKQPNPLSIKKKKKTATGGAPQQQKLPETTTAGEGENGVTGEGGKKKRRRRTHGGSKNNGDEKDHEETQEKEQEQEDHSMED